jgi:hypothetical protein
MRYRIAGWASVGFLVACGWALYFAAAGKAHPMEPFVNLLVRLTCPIALLSSYPLGLYLVLLANVATYALVGFIVETTRRQLKHAH